MSVATDDAGERKEDIRLAGLRELTGRDVAALTEVMSVLPDVGWARHAPDCYLVVTESGREYRVDHRERRCTCDDELYRAPEGGCKHLRRLDFEVGDRAVPEAVDRDALDDPLR